MNNGLYSVTIKDIPQDERPIERLIACGPEALSTAEIMAIVIRCGTRGENVVDLASRLLNSCGSMKNLACADFAELASVKGIGRVKAAQLKAAIELGKRVVLADFQEKKQVENPEDIVNMLMPKMRYLHKEEFRAVFLDTRNRILDVVTISVGSLDTSIVHPREVFREAVRRSSASVIFVHNHPSGDPVPSEEDIAVTKRLMQAGELLGVQVLDHIVIGDNVFVSFKNKNILF